MRLVVAVSASVTERIRAASLSRRGDGVAGGARQMKEPPLGPGRCPDSNRLWKTHRVYRPVPDLPGARAGLPEPGAGRSAPRGLRLSLSGSALRVPLAGAALSMAYMDVRPAQPNGRTVVLLHGKNFCGATWEDTIGPLRDAGYRVVVPDQIGFCKSTKPQAYQFGLHQLAANTHALLASSASSGRSSSAIPWAACWPCATCSCIRGETSGLVLVNPIGLEDWKAKGVPFVTDRPAL